METTPRPELVAFCGLYCAQCGKFKKGKCPGCAGNEKASWCGIRKCCLEHGYATCADCTEFADPMACGKFNNFISRLVGFVLRSDRAAGIARIKAVGRAGFAAEMETLGRAAVKR
jgi:hypothetical protein